jgi:hypothetical protein
MATAQRIGYDRSQETKGEWHMITFTVTHPDHPEDATTQAINCLAAVGVRTLVEGNLISLTVPAESEIALAALKKNGFVISFGAQATYQKLRD